VSQQANDDYEEEDQEEVVSEDGRSSSDEDPEWMSFSTPNAGDLLTNFEEIWSQRGQDELEHDAQGDTKEPVLANPVELTSEAIWDLVADRAQKEIARALEEAERNRMFYGALRPEERRCLLRRGQSIPSRRPRRGERSELVADLARNARSELVADLRQGAAAASSKASNSQLLRPVAQRLGNGVLRAGSAMQDAGRLAREAGAVVASRAHGHGHGVAPEAIVADAKKLEADAKNAKTKAVHAANAMKSKLMQKMPNSLRRRRKEENSDP